MYADAASAGAPTLGTDTTTDTTDTTDADHTSTSTLSKVRKALLSNTSESVVKTSSRITTGFVAVVGLCMAVTTAATLALALWVSLQVVSVVFNVHVGVFSSSYIRVHMDFAWIMNGYSNVGAVWRGTGAASDTVVGASYRLARWALPA